MTTNEGKKKQFVLCEDEARKLAGTCTTFRQCYCYGHHTTKCLHDMLDFIGPLSKNDELLRRAIANEYEVLENRLELAAKFGGWFKEMVKKIRTHWMVDDIVKLFAFLWAQKMDELRV